MCRVIEVNFACKHKRKSGIFDCCSRSSPCLLKQRGLGLQSLESLNFDKLPEDLVASLHLSGVYCEDCTAAMRNMLVSQSRELASLQKDLKEMAADVQGLQKAQQQEQNIKDAITVANRITSQYRKSLVRPLATKRTHALCSSGSCSNQAIVRSDGRRGEFCKSHTCSAQNWGCLGDVYRVDSERKGPLFCPAHTCSIGECQARVWHRKARLCERHRWFETDVYAWRAKVIQGEAAESPEMYY